MIKKFTVRTLGAIALLIITHTVSFPIVQANSLTPLTSIHSIYFDPPPVPSRGAPGNRSEGASRGDCVRSNIPLTALVPSFNSPTSKTVWGLTTHQRPTLWFYIPFAPTCSTIKFVLQDQQGKSLYQLSVATPTKPSIIGVQLPDNASILEPDQLYHWLLQVDVKLKPTDDPEDITASFGVNGWIQRVNPDPKLGAQLQQVQPLQQARLYAEHGVWFDALTVLAGERLTNSQSPEITQDLKNLLHSVELDNLAAQPITVGAVKNATQTGN